MPESVFREVCILQAFLRQEERRRRRLLREIAAVRLWQNARGHSALTRWISSNTVQRRESELREVVRNVVRLRLKFDDLVAQYPHCTDYLPEHGEVDGATATVPKILLQRPISRPCE